MFIYITCNNRLTALQARLPFIQLGLTLQGCERWAAALRASALLFVCLGSLHVYSVHVILNEICQNRCLGFWTFTGWIKLFPSFILHELKHNLLINSHCEVSESSNSGCKKQQCASQRQCFAVYHISVVSGHSRAYVSFQIFFETQTIKSETFAIEYFVLTFTFFRTMWF